MTNVRRLGSGKIKERLLQEVALRDLDSPVTLQDLLIDVLLGKIIMNNCDKNLHYGQFTFQ